MLSVERILGRPQKADVVLLLQRRRPRTKKHVCGICGKKLSTTSSLDRHLKYHRGERRHACPKCPYRAVARDKLVRHMNTHLAERPFKCQHCNFATIRASSLTSHLRNKHTENSESGGGGGGGIFGLSSEAHDGLADVVISDVTGGVDSDDDDDIYVYSW